MTFDEARCVAFGVADRIVWALLYIGAPAVRLQAMQDYNSRFATGSVDTVFGVGCDACTQRLDYGQCSNRGCSRHKRD